MKRPTHGGNLAWAASLASCPPSLIVDFSASINPLGPPKTALAAIESGQQDLVAYPDPNYYQLRVSLSQLHPTLDPDWILPGNGCAELLTWAGRELAQLEETCLVTPAFSDYRRALQAFSGNVREYFLELGIMGCPIPNFPSPIPKTVGLLLNNPHNPTGCLWNIEEIKPYLEQFALVVVDEAFMDFLPPPQQQSLIPMVQEYPNLVILRSLTKFYSLPGLRIGYAIAHPERLQRWQQWRDPWAVNSLAAAAATAVVQDTEFQQKTWAWLESARSQLFQGLAQLPGLQPYLSAANFLLVQSEPSSSQLQEKLLKHSQLLIRDCLSFPELGDRYFRVAVRTPEENQRLLEALSAILS
ncbi:MAG: threonine-phosphate decarboxylase [Symploca sp. SIO2E6]|nr:threonine-phosphate decarboxylase [Symploca sp. SIO2E6]